MKIANKLFSALLAFTLLSGAAQADTITQDFNSSWTVTPWDYYGDVAAANWQYIPYNVFDSSMGTLQSVTITTEISGSRDAGDDLSLRTAFFTGWSPDQFQFYDATTIAAGTASFDVTRTFTSGTDFALDNFIHYNYLPLANYYFESKSTLTHTIDAHTSLTYVFIPTVPEPASYLLMLAGLIALFAVGKREAPAFE